MRIHFPVMYNLRLSIIKPFFIGFGFLLIYIYSKFFDIKKKFCSLNKKKYSYNSFYNIGKKAYILLFSTKNAYYITTLKKYHDLLF